MHVCPEEMNAAVFQKLSAAAGRRIVPFSACRPEIHLYVCALSCQIRKMICVTQRRIPLRMSQHRGYREIDSLKQGQV